MPRQGVIFHEPARNALEPEAFQFDSTILLLPQGILDTHKTRIRLTASPDT